MKTLFIIIISPFIIFAIVVICAFGMDFYKIMKYSDGWVWQDRHGTAVKDFIKEEDNCIYFIDVWDRDIKTCGTYQIEKSTK